MYIGIDPGESGAVALLHGSKLIVYDMPLRSEKRRGKVVTEIDTGELLRRLYLCAAGAFDEPAPCVRAYLEQVGGMPRQGGAAAFQFGRAYGQVEAACIAAGFSPVYVPPAKWQADARLIGKDKAAACALAASVWPEHAHLFYGPRGGLRDGAADAALIARYGQRTEALADA